MSPRPLAAGNHGCELLPRRTDRGGRAGEGEHNDANAARRRLAGDGIALTRNGHWEDHAAAHAANVGPMRIGLVEFAAGHGAGRNAQADIALAMSEGLTNAVLHAFVARAVGTMRVIAAVSADVLHVSIIDDGSGMSARDDSPGLGLGLTVIDRLTSSLEIRGGPGGQGTELRLTLDVPGMRADGAGSA